MVLRRMLNRNGYELKQLGRHFVVQAVDWLRGADRVMSFHFILTNNKEKEEKKKEKRKKKKGRERKEAISLYTGFQLQLLAMFSSCHHLAPAHRY